MMEVTKKQRNAFVEEKYEKKKLPIAVELGAYHVDHLIRAVVPVVWTVTGEE